MRAPCAHRAKFRYIHCHRQCFSPIAAQIYHVFVLGHPWYRCVLQPRKYGAELGTLGHMVTIRLKKKFLVYQQGPTGAELGTLGHMATIRLKKKFLVYQ